MPVVPKYDRQVGQAALQTGRVQESAPLEAFGGGQGLEPIGAANRLVDVGQQIAQKEKSRADDTRVKEAYAKMVRAEQDLLLNPKTGAYVKKGKDSFGVPDEYGEMFDKTANEISAELGNEDQRAMFEEIRLKRRTQFDGDLMQHVAKESQIYEKQVTDAAIGATMDEAILNYKDQTKVAESIKAQEGLLRDLGDKQGAAPEVIEQMVSEQRAKTHAGIIERFLSNDEDMAAAAYFEANKDGITDGNIRADLEKALEEGSIRGESQRQSDAIMSKGLPMSRALEEIKEIKDPKLRDAVQDRVRGEYGLREAARRDAVEKSHLNSLNILDQTGGDIDQVMKSPAWRTYSQSERTGLMAYARNKKEGRDSDTDFETYYGLRGMAASNPNDFKQINLADPKYLSKLNKTDRETLVDLQMSVRKGDGKASKVLDGYRTEASIVNDTLRQMDINPSPKPGSNDAKRVAEFRRKVDMEVINKKSQLNRNLNNNEFQEIVDSLAPEVVTKKGFIFDTKKRVFELEAGDSVEEIKLDQIPSGMRKQIEDALRSRNKPVNEQSIIDLYSVKLKKIRGS